MKGKILKNSELQRDYIELWLSKLWECDRTECQQYNDRRFKELILKENFEAPEKYGYDILYGNQEIKIFFRVSRLLQLLERTTNEAITYFDMNEFVKEDSYIKWDRTDRINKIKAFPILIAPITVGKYIKLVVVDGNPRLTSWIEDDRKHIPCIILDGQALVDNNMFVSAFSKLFYVFQNELVALATYSIRDNINDTTLISKSYLKTGKMLYNI